MIRTRLQITNTACLPNLALVLCTAFLTAGIIAAQTREALPGDSRILTAAGGRLQFHQRGTELVLPVVSGADTISVTLPHQMTVNTAAGDGDSMWIAGRANSADIERMYVLEVDAKGTPTLLPSPAGREQMRTFPVLLADRGRVTGIAWQEGDSTEQNSIRAAAWKGDHWGPVEVIAPALGREQTGLEMTVLTDGSWLAVWALADDLDDLWWSRRTRGTWSEPKRVHATNEVPDVSPRLAPTRDGALLVWSWYDGNDYRLRLARFARNAWTELPIESGRGADAVGWLELASGPAILTSSVIPEVWSLIEVDDTGKAVNRTAGPIRGLGEPMVLERSGQRLLNWNPGPAEGSHVEVELLAIGGPER